MADVFHTFFGICGLSLLGYFQSKLDFDESAYSSYGKFRPIDPTYALPEDIVTKLGLRRQRLTM